MGHMSKELQDLLHRLFADQKQLSARRGHISYQLQKADSDLKNIETQIIAAQTLLNCLKFNEKEET